MPFFCGGMDFSFFFGVVLRAVSAECQMIELR
jgi:hypothetical protein